jgi:hypothetical protein
MLRIFTPVFTVALILLPAASAGTLTYTFAGVGSGTIAGATNAAFSDAAFNVTFSLDTGTIVVPDVGFTRYNNVSGIFTEDSYTTTFTNTTIVANGNGDTGMGSFETIFLFNSDFGSDIGISSDPTLSGYSLAKTVTTGVVTGPDVSGFSDAAGFSTTTGDIVNFTGLTSLDFTAASPNGSAAPEPSTLALITLGLGGVVLLRRRRSS